MSNERIDLTQFEGIKEWKVIPYHHDKVIDWQVKTGRNMRSKEEAETIAKLPTLIAELKIRYEMIDKISHIWFCSPNLSEEHHADITKLLADYEGINL